MKLYRLFTFMLAVGASQFAIALPTTGTFQAEYSVVKSYDYLIHFPEGYDPEGDSVGLLLFLHGSGERGGDLELVKTWGPPQLIEENKTDFPVVVVSPQCPVAERWDPIALKLLIQDLKQQHNIDPNRIYVSGLSMGGFGTWALAAIMPDELAAIVPICGGGDPTVAPMIKDVPNWVFHGAKDKVVELYQSTRIVSPLNELGAPVKFTVYPEADHVGAWVKAYNNKRLWEWMWEQSLGKRNSDLPDPTRVESAINAFEAADEIQFPKSNGIVCVGSSSLAIWNSAIEKDLAPLPVIPRGFGGSLMSDVVHYADRIVLPYRPKAVLLYEGDNDAALGVSPYVFIDQMDQFVKIVHNKLPECDIFILPAKPSIARTHVWEPMKLTNRLKKQYCEGDGRLHYIDIASPMLGADGQPRQELFEPDRLHMNQKGYKLWKSIIKSRLMEWQS